MIKHLLAGVAALVTATAAGAETYAIQAGRLIVDAAQPERGPSTVVVENGRISRIENGLQRLTLDLMYPLARALGVGPNDLIEGGTVARGVTGLR